MVFSVAFSLLASRHNIRIQRRLGRRLVRWILLLGRGGLSIPVDIAELQLSRALHIARTSRLVDTGLIVRRLGIESRWIDNCISMCRRLLVLVLHGKSKRRGWLEPYAMGRVEFAMAARNRGFIREIVGTQGLVQDAFAYKAGTICVGLQNVMEG